MCVLIRQIFVGLIFTVASFTLLTPLDLSASDAACQDTLGNSSVVKTSKPSIMSTVSNCGTFLSALPPLIFACMIADTGDLIERKKKNALCAMGVLLEVFESLNCICSICSSVQDECKPCEATF